MPKTEPKRPILSVSAVALCLVVIWYLAVGGGSKGSKMSRDGAQTYQFQAVTGFFMQDEPDTRPKEFDVVREQATQRHEIRDHANMELQLKNNFGLINRTYDTDKPGDESLTQWQRFDNYVRHLVRTAPAGTTYKVIYMGRHGEGYHNVAEAKYGTAAWDAYWSKLDSDGELFWFDAHLTPRGKQQALDNNAFFKHQLAASVKMPAPQRYYVSPLYRCLQTADSTFAGLNLPDDRPFKPVVKELLREVMGEHTCDKRSSKTVIHNAFPKWDIEAGFTESDELWQADHRETVDERAKRTQELLDDIFTHDESLVISFTSHSGMTAALLYVLNHREFRIPTGGLVPVLVKAAKLSS